MKIRTRLTLQFLIIGGVLMIISSAAIYLSSATFRRDDYFNRLENKSTNTTKLIIEAEKIDNALLQKIEDENPVSLPSEIVIILNIKNEIIYSTDRLKVLKYDEKLLNNIRLYEKMKFIQEPYEVLGLAYAKDNSHYVIIAAAIDSEGLSKLRNLRIILVVVLILSLIGISVAGWFYAGRALNPISKVIRQVEDISVSSLNLRVDEGNGTDEIARLARTFNKMLDSIEEAFKMQKEFISNASHEMRTPLTSIYGQLQVLLMKERSQADYQTSIISVTDDIRNLTDLSNSLLLLAQATSLVSDKHTSIVRIDEILWQARDEIIKVHKDYLININIDCIISSDDMEPLAVHGNEYLLKVAVQNIIENACKYSSDNTSDVKIECIPGFVMLSFIDSGIGIPEDDIEKIFEPFHRGKNALSIRGHGIGLPLVQRIVRNHNGTIAISSVVDEGTKVTIQLPIA